MARGKEAETAHMFDRNGHVSHWWAALCAVPAEKDSDAYRRLRRVWFDHTRFRGPRQSPDNKAKRYHEFVKPTAETHLTVTLWENFALFPSNEWVPVMFAGAGLPPLETPVLRCNWSYEWVTEIPTRKMCDIVMEVETHDTRYVVVVEAKRLDSPVTGDDLNQSYYLDTIPELCAFGERQRLIYLIDQTRVVELAAALQPKNKRIGILTWQKLAGLQISLAKRINAPAPITNFVASAIQFQFGQHNIRPSSLSADYLVNEPSGAEIDHASATNGQLMTDHYMPYWRLSN